MRQFNIYIVSEGKNKKKLNKTLLTFIYLLMFAQNLEE